MLAKCFPIVISSYRLIQKKKKKIQGDNSNPLKMKNHDRS